MVTVNLRNVPDDVREIFERRAANAGMTVSDYLLQELHRIAEQPTMEQLRTRIAQQAVERGQE